MVKMLFVNAMEGGNDGDFGLHEGETRGLSFLKRKSGTVRQKPWQVPLGNFWFVTSLKYFRVDNSGMS
jgi:hypothetical protein